jgi:hypothetical protein
MVYFIDCAPRTACTRQPIAAIHIIPAPNASIAAGNKIHSPAPIDRDAKIIPGPIALKRSENVLGGGGRSKISGGSRKST